MVGEIVTTREHFKSLNDSQSQIGISSLSEMLLSLLQSVTAMITQPGNIYRNLGSPHTSRSLKKQDVKVFTTAKQLLHSPRLRQPQATFAPLHPFNALFYFQRTYQLSLVVNFQMQLISILTPPFFDQPIFDNKSIN